MNRFPDFLCLFHPGALGDGLLALKAVRVLKNRFPDHLVVWFGHKELGEVLVACQEVHQAYSFDESHFLVSGKSVHVKEGIFSDLFKRCERAVGWMDDSDGTWKRNFFEAGIETAIIRSPHDLRLQAHHMTDRYLEILEPWLVGENGRSLEDDFSEEALLAFPGTGKRNTFDSSQGPLIILHPGSGSPYKCTPLRVLATLANGLMTAPGRRLCVVGGPADHESVGQLQAALRSMEITVLQEMDLLSMSRFLRQAHLFIGHDSGLSHLAAGLGVPSLLLFGPTDPSRWAPRGEHVAVMRHVCQCLNVDAMRQCRDQSCLSFSIDEALKNAENLLSRKQILASTGSSLNS